jgi:excisionase family DNA binding protein
VTASPTPIDTSDTDGDRDDAGLAVRHGRLLVTIPEAAVALAVGRTTIYQLIWTGQLTPIHIGRSVRLALEELEDFVDSRLTREERSSDPVRM